MTVAHWLLKSDPESFSIDDLERAPARTTSWDGVRNAEARNSLRDRIRVGDLGLLYHSHSKSAPAAIVGIVEVVGAGRPDPTAFDRKDDHYDPKSDRARPTWYMVDVKLVRRLERPVTLDEVKRSPKLAKMALVKRGRLSVAPVTTEEWSTVLDLARRREDRAAERKAAAGFSPPKSSS